jgi:peptide/nickel transport system permease protein
VAFCFAGPFVWRADPSFIDAAASLAPPSLAHPAGTDALGRDELARLIAGGAASLRAAIPAAALAFLIGTAYGLASGLGPRWLDRLLMLLLDAILSLPALVVLIALAALVPVTPLSLALLIGLVAWPPLARLVRGEVLALRQRDYILAARQFGAGPLYLARAHLLPVLAPLLAVNVTQLVGDGILGVSALSFLGLGLAPPATSWGQLLQEGTALIPLHAWWLVLPPGLLIAASLLATAAAGRWWLHRRPA